MKSIDTERTERRGVALVMECFEALGFAFREQAESDYGIDGHAELIDAELPTGQLLGIQIKSGVSYLSESTGTAFVFRTDADHVVYWLNHALPVVICLCDIEKRVIYWSPVTKEIAIPTGKGFKFNVPVSQTLSSQSLSQLKDLLTPLIPPNRYTVFKTEDLSHGLAKRYSFSVVINGTASKAEISSVVRQVTTDGAKRRYHRNHLVEGRWGDADAHVVWTFVYPSAEDHARHNHICRSLWMNESLDDAARPSPIKGENIGNNIFVEWSETYDFLATHALENTLTKEGYLSAVRPLIEELKTLLVNVEANLSSLTAGDFTDALFLCTTDHARRRISKIYMEITDMPLAPFECKDMDGRLECFIACMDNISVFYSDKGRGMWSESERRSLSLQQCLDARKHLVELEYESKKVR
ncbi:MAG TPA: DUF4365 domain-containing protein [Pirellulales bacterium]|nr:DUF4365 domain-containing protein [Pirellulales bacterium]